MLENLKLGPLDGYSALVVIIVVALALVSVIIVALINAIKAIKERKDAKEDAAENAFYAEYGITGEEMRLNQKLARMRAKLKNRKLLAQNMPKPVAAPVAQEPAPVEELVVEENVNEQPQALVEEPIKEEPIKEEPVQESEPVKEEEPAPIVEEVKPQEEEKPAQEPTPVVEEVAPQAEPEPVVEPVVEPAPVVEPEPVAEEPKKQGVEKPATKKIVKKKPDDWSKYDGSYEGYYYDPEDACYYEGKPSAALAKKLAAKDAELEALNANKDKKVVIKKVAPPFAALKTPKNARKAPQAVAGFDEAVIYGKYIIEHVDTQEGTQEWFYTLYDANGNDIYESSNYSSKEYCERAINRFKSHAIIGAYTIEAADGKFFFVLKRKTYVHKGAPVATFEEASKLQSNVKKFAQTDIIREQ